MQLNTVVRAIFVCCMFVLTRGAPARNAMVYYQTYPQYYSARQTVPLANRMMYVQYVRPRSNSASGGEITSFAAGNTASSGTFFTENDAPQSSNAPFQPSYASGNEATAIAEAYPALYYPAEESDANGTPVKGQEEFEFEQDPADVPEYDPVPDLNKKDKDQAEFVPKPDTDFVAFAPDPTSHDVGSNDAEFASPTARPSTAGPSYIPPKKKIRVDVNKPDYDLNRRKPASAPAATPYFPVSFGRTDGGSIAIANSYSTGEGGAATSRAIAFGDPAAYRFYKKASRH